MFSLSWFTTIPGLLITGGVLLLVIALVIFIVTSRKDKKEKKNNEVDKNSVTVPVQNVSQAAAPVGVQPVAMPAVDMGGTPAPVQPVTPVSVGMPEIAVNPVNTQDMSVNVMPTIQPPEVAFNNVSSMPGENIAPTPEIPVVATPEINSIAPPVVGSDYSNINNEVAAVPYVSNVMNQSVVNNSLPVTPDITSYTTAVENNIPSYPENPINNIVDNAVVSPTPVVEEVPTMPINNGYNMTQEQVVPSVEQVVPEMQDVVAPTITNTVDSYSAPSIAPVSNTSIYGGANPVVSDVAMPEVSQQHQIYGGANPLETTQSVPIAEIANEINANNTQPVIQPEVQVMQSAPVYQQSAVSYEQPSVMPTAPTAPVVPNYTAQQQAYIPDTGVAINNNFAYQTAPVQAPNSNIPQ